MKSFLTIVLALTGIPCLIALPPLPTAARKAENDVKLYCKRADLLLPECLHPKPGKVDKLCFLVIDYAFQGCNITQKFSNETYSCPMELVPAKRFLTEYKEIADYLANQQNCSIECSSKPKLCNQVFNLANYIRLYLDMEVNKSTPVALKPEIQKPVVEDSLAGLNPDHPDLHSKDAKKEDAVKNSSPQVEQINVTANHLQPPQSPVNPSQPTQSKYGAAGDVVNAPPKPAINEHIGDIEPEAPKEAKDTAAEEGVDVGDNNQPNINEEGDDVDDEANEFAQKNDDVMEPPLNEEDNYERKPAAVSVGIAPVESDRHLDLPRIHTNGPFQETPDSHFFFYFLSFVSVSAVGYIAFHNKNKILALVLEGRRGRQNRRRPNSAGYRKLDTSLEEAMMSHPSRGPATQVIY